MKKKTVFILGQLATYGGAGIVADEFRKRADWDVHLIAAEPDEPQGFWIKYGAELWSEKNWFQRRAARRLARNADLTILAGTPALDIWMRTLLAKPAGRSGKTTYSRKVVARGARKLKSPRTRGTVALLVTDSFLLNANPETNELYNLFPEARLFVMPDLIPFVDRKDLIPFYPAIQTNPSLAPKQSRGGVLVGHSPSSSKRYNQKGTNFILETLEKSGISHDLISGLEYEAALARKAKLDVFVDQIAPQKFKGLCWSGGLGKSGLEAMAVGCAVITSGHLAKTEPFMPLPPIILADRTNFEEKLLKLVNDPDEIARMGKAAREWVETYATPKVIVNYLLKHSGQESD